MVTAAIWAAPMLAPPIAEIIVVAIVAIIIAVVIIGTLVELAALFKNWKEEDELEEDCGCCSPPPADYVIQRPTHSIGGCSFGGPEPRRKV